MVTVPGPKKMGLLEREAPTALVTGIGSVITGAATAFKAFGEVTSNLLRGLALASVGLATLGLLFKVHQARKKDAKEENLDGPLEITSALYLVHTMVCGAAPNTKVRVTLHAVVGESLVQCVPYVGGIGGAAGRKFDIRSGVIGSVARSGDVVLTRRTSTDHEAFVREMMTAHSMTEKEARDLDPSRFAWYGIPLFADEKPDQKPVAVLFFDSDQADAFTNDVQAVACTAAKGLALYIRKHYS
jgi:hypothetical protein